MLKRLALSTTALTFFLLGADPAAAGPLVGAIAGVIGAIASGAGIAQVVLGLAMSIGSTLLQMALTPDQPKQQPVGVKLQVEVGDDKAVSTTIGRTATRGRRKYIGSYGDQNGTPNSHMTEVIELGNLPVSGLSGIWIDDEKCTILWDEAVSRGFPIEEYRVEDDGEFTDYAWVRFHDGTQTQADAYLIDKFGDHEKRPWTASMVGRGVPYAVMTYRFNRKLFRGQPACLFEMAPLPLYDIRKDSTNGGSGSHRWSDTATWEPSENLAVMTYNVIRGLKYKNEWFYGGQDVAEHRLPSSSWIAAAQECGRLIDNADGSREPQFRGGLEIAGDVLPIEVVEEFRKAMGGRLADTAGVFKLKNGAFGAAVFAFTDAEVLVTSPQAFEPFPALDQTINAINAVYPEPDEAWASKDAPALRLPDLEERDGKRLPADIAFRAAPHKRQVQRLMRAALKEERRFRKHQVPLPPEAYALEPGIDVVTWTSEHNGYVNKRFLVVEVEGEPTMNQLVTLQEIDPSDYDWSTDFELPTAVGWLGRIAAPVQIMQGWSAVKAEVTDQNGLSRRPAIRVSCAANLDDVKRVWVRVRVKATGAVVFSSDQYPYGVPFNWLVSGNWCLPATEYQVSGKLVPFSNRETAWSSWLDVTTDDIRFSADDLHLLEITKEVTADVVKLSQWIWQDNNIRRLIDDSTAMARSIAEQDLANFADKQQLRREIATTTGQFASFIEQITVASSTTAALASQVTQLAASLGSKADVSALNSTVAEVAAQGGQITAHGASITAITASLNDKASVSALDAVSTTVTSHGNSITAQGTLINSLSAQVGEATADARLRFEVVNTGISGYSKVGLQARFGTAEDYRTAGLFAYVPSNPNQLARVVVNAGRFAVAAGDDELGSQIFAVDATGVYIDTAYIRNISTSKITFEDGSVQTSALAQGAATKLFSVATIDTVTMTTVFQGVADTNVSKTVDDGIVINADIIARATTLVGGKASLLIELREDNVMIKESTLEFTALGASQTATFYHMRTSGSGVFNYKIVVKKSASGEDFFIGRRTIAPVVYKKAN
ncbi:hypothetical protein [Pararhizobium sp. A13]|uniref:hypothetical protein n=1 Tax=Pararhizobium sp. A13 TaxID=3133975 RepID=UPI00325596B9